MPTSFFYSMILVRWCTISYNSFDISLLCVVYLFVKVTLSYTSTKQLVLYCKVYYFKLEVNAT